MRILRIRLEIPTKIQFYFSLRPMLPNLLQSLMRKNEESPPSDKYHSFALITLRSHQRIKSCRDTCNRSKSDLHPHKTQIIFTVRFLSINSVFIQTFWYFRAPISPNQAHNVYLGWKDTCAQFQENTSMNEIVMHNIFLF